MWKHKKSEWETWKASFQSMMNNQTQPMHQLTYWTLFLVSSITFIIGLLMGSVTASHDFTDREPQKVHISLGDTILGDK